MGLGCRAKMEADATNQAGIDIAFGRMANQARWFIDNQQFVVFVNDVEEFFQIQLSTFSPTGVSSFLVKEKWNIWLPVILMVVFACTRWPGLLPPNFSACYALAFCAGVYFPRRLAWWLPLGTMLASDVALNLYYYFHLHVASFQLEQLVNYGVYALIIWLGTRFNPKSSWAKLLGGGLLGAVLFYCITNTASWLFNPFHNPEYTKNLLGWFTALTKGTAGWPQTWEFFRNTLLSGGLFTGLFVGAMKASEAAESAREKEGAPVPPQEAEAEKRPQTQESEA